MEKAISRLCDYLTAILRSIPLLCLVLSLLNLYGVRYVPMTKLLLLLLYPCLLLLIRSAVSDLALFSPPFWAGSRGSTGYTG